MQLPPAFSNTLYIRTYSDQAARRETLPRGPEEDADTSVSGRRSKPKSSEGPSPNPSSPQPSLSSPPRRPRPPVANTGLRPLLRPSNTLGAGDTVTYAGPPGSRKGRRPLPEAGDRGPRRLRLATRPRPRPTPGATRPGLGPRSPPPPPLSRKHCARCCTGFRGLPPRRSSGARDLDLFGPIQGRDS